MSKSRLVQFKIADDDWEIIHYVGLKQFVVYKNNIVARELHNIYKTEADAMVALLNIFRKEIK